MLKNLTVRIFLTVIFLPKNNAGNCSLKILPKVGNAGRLLPKSDTTFCFAGKPKIFQKNPQKSVSFLFF